MIEKAIESKREKKCEFEKAMNENEEKKREGLKKLKGSFYKKFLNESLEKRGAQRV